MYDTINFEFNIFEILLLYVDIKYKMVHHCKNYTGYQYLIKGKSCVNFNFNIDLVGEGSLGGSENYEALLTFTQRLSNTCYKVNYKWFSELVIGDVVQNVEINITGLAVIISENRFAFTGSAVGDIGPLNINGTSLSLGFNLQIEGELNIGKCELVDKNFINGFIKFDVNRGENSFDFTETITILNEGSGKLDKKNCC